MPTLTTLALETLLQQKKPQLASETLPNSNHRHVYIRPDLYSTPVQSPVPDFPAADPISPSPYVANNKRRRGYGVAKENNEERITVEVPELPLGDDVSEDLGPEDVGDSFGNNEPDAEIECRSFVSAAGEFFDANEDFSSDGSTSSSNSYGRSTESELQSLKISLLEEIGKRKSAEETLASIHRQWERLRNLFESELCPPVASDDENLVGQLCQEIVVMRFVSEAIGGAMARMEAEESATITIELKDQEISRLRDRLQYYEIVNHEMSQRKLAEVARRQQERKRSSRVWLWTLMSLSIAMGASLFAYSCYPQHSSSCSSNNEVGEGV